MQTRILYTKFWKDSFVRSLTPIQSYIFIYLLTNEHVNIIHCYECPLDIISFETKIETKTIVETIKILEKNKKIAVCDEYIFLLNSGKYESFRGPQNEAKKRKLYAEMSNKVKKWYDEIDTPIHTGIDTPMDTNSIGTRNQKSEIRNQKSEIRNQKSVDEVKKEIRSKIKRF